MVIFSSYQKAYGDLASTGTSLVLFACMVGDFIGLERLPIAFAILGVTNGMFFFLKPMFFGEFIACRESSKSSNFGGIQLMIQNN